MHSEFVLSGTQRIVLNLVEYGPVSLAQATASCQVSRGGVGADGRDVFKEAAIALLCRGLIRASGEHLTITIAGRVALADCQLSSRP